MRIFKALRVILLSTILLVLLSFFTFPKFLIFDRLLLERKVFLLAQRVKENLLSLELFKGRVYFRDKEVIHFDFAKLSLGFLSIESEVRCGRKTSRAVYSFFGGLEVILREFTCSPFVKEVNGRLKVKEGVYGRIKLRGLKTNVVVLDEVNLNFKGKTFTGSVKYLGMELKGSGRISLNSKNLLMSRVDGEFRGGGLKIKVFGTIKNLSISAR